MYNKGEKLKIISLTILILGCISSIAYGIYLFMLKVWVWGFLIIIIGPTISYLYKFFIDCFADLIQRVDVIGDNTINIIDKLNKDKKIVQEPSTQEKKNKKPTKLDHVKNEIRHLNTFEKNYVIEHNPDLYKKIKNMTLDSLYEVVEKRKESQEYIYLCCFEILNRLKGDT